MDGWVGINNCLVACGDIALLRMDPAHCEEVGRGDPFRALETDRFLHRVPGGNAASRLLWVSNCPPHPSLNPPHPSLNWLNCFRSLYVMLYSMHYSMPYECNVHQRDNTLAKRGLLREQ